MIQYLNGLVWNVPSFQAEKWEYANQKRGGSNSNP